MATETTNLIIQPGDIINEDDIVSNINKYTPWFQSIDVILLLGGGVPVSPTEPPFYVQRRCDVVAHIIHTMQHSNVAVICLSAGTAHVKQYITPDGLPLWESTASAAYLIHHKQYPLSSHQVYAETTSYDTISNAFFTRTSFTDLNHDKWRKVLVVTNEFHIHRSQAIFDWVFSVPSSRPTNYEMYYLSCNNVGLSNEALASRKEHEARGEANIRTKLAIQYTTLHDVWNFLITNHDFYSAEKLVSRGVNNGGNDMNERSDNLLKLSYGRSTDTTTAATMATPKHVVEYKGGQIVLSLNVYFVVATLVVTVIGIVCSWKSRTRSCPRNRKSK